MEQKIKITIELDREKKEFSLSGQIGESELAFWCQITGIIAETILGFIKEKKCSICVKDPSIAHICFSV